MRNDDATTAVVAQGVWWPAFQKHRHQKQQQQQRRVTRAYICVTSLVNGDDQTSLQLSVAPIDHNRPKRGRATMHEPRRFQTKDLGREQLTIVYIYVYIKRPWQQGFAHEHTCMSSV